MQDSCPTIQNYNILIEKYSKYNKNNDEFACLLDSNLRIILFDLARFKPLECVKTNRYLSCLLIMISGNIILLKIDKMENGYEKNE